MDVAAIDRANNTINTGASTLASNYDTFLSLLTTQLKNQDPLSPMDTNQFTQQLTAMTGVQQQLLTNQLLTQLIGQNQANVGAGAINLVGKTVTIDTPQTMLTDDGATWNYDLAGASADTKIEILNGASQVVWAGKATDAHKGANTFTWNGKSQTGASLPKPALYTLRVSATDATNNPVAWSAHLTAIATGVKTAGGETLITVGGVDAPLTAVTGVSSAAS